MNRHRIRARRKRLKLTQGQLAAAVGISAQALRQFELGHLRLSAATIERLQDALGLGRLQRAKAHLTAAANLLAAEAAA